MYLNCRTSQISKCACLTIHWCYFNDVARGLFLSVAVSHPPGGVNGGLTGPKEWVTELQLGRGNGENHNWRRNGRRGREKKTWNNPVVRAPRESVRGKGEGVGYPACRKNGTGEGAAAFLLAVQEPERPRNLLRERRRYGAQIHRLLNWPRGGSLPRTHSEVLQLQWNPPGLWPWPLTDAVWRKGQRDGPQGECRVQQARWVIMWHFRLAQGHHSQLHVLAN